MQNAGPLATHAAGLDGLDWREIPFDQAVTLGKHGGDRKSEKAKDQGDNVTLKERGNSRAYILARLDRDGHAELADVYQKIDAEDRTNQRPAGRPATTETLDTKNEDVKGFPSGASAT